MQQNLSPKPQQQTGPFEGCWVFSLKMESTLKYLCDIRLERFKNAWSYISLPPLIFTAFCVIKDRQRQSGGGRKIYLYLGLKRINILEKQRDRADKVHGES
jgi:hypothetical protein